MTRAKKLKRTVRARARKTGESYASARRQVLEARRRRSARPLALTAAAPAPRAATAARPAAGASSRPRRTTGDDAVRRKTGHGLDHWFAVLDAFGAAAKGHTASARHLFEEHGVPGWHCQMITVEYERARGLRATNQSCEGDFQVSVSRTVPAAPARVAAALSDARQRALWLREADARLARALGDAFAGPKARGVLMKKADQARLRFRWDGGVVEISVNGKAGGKSSVVAQNTRLPSAVEVERRRRAWAAALDGLKAHLSS